ncbi:MAG: cytochrome ubiquinol oxidase subunit I [Actinobacteria bacterium]|nr:MAG: cytochrome ubiquinol oxidase subunit I [Actinomycetota bacterium]
MAQAPEGAGAGDRHARRAGVHEQRLRELPPDPRHCGTRPGRPRSHAPRVTHDARRRDDGEHPPAARGLGARPAAREARKQDAAGPDVAAGLHVADRLPGGAQIAVETLPPRSRERADRLERIWEERPGLLGWLTTVDHKRIGLLYLFTTLAFFGAGGIEALLIRTQLAGANGKVLGPDAYNQAMTMHGVTMIFFFIVPIGIGAFGNYLIPLMIGARDMAFPRMNALSYWIFLASGLFLYSSVFLGKAPNCGWFCYTPLNTRQFDPGLNVDFYALGLIFNGISSTAGAINLIVTVFKLRAPGMSLNRMPLFAYAILAVSFSLVFALPVLTVDLLFLELQRKAGFHFFDVAHGGDPLLWQHLFWFFGHPEVYIIILPAMGIATSIIPTFAKRKMIAFPLVALAELLVAFIGFGVWAHHMFATGIATAQLIFFAGASMMVVIPSTIQIFAWLFTVNLGKPDFRAPLLFIGGFIALFVIGGLSGIMFAAIPFDQATTDSYFVVAHFHFIIFGAAVFPLLGGMYYWFPKVTGRMYHEGWAKASFWVTFVGTMLTFFPMHIVGLLGMTRRIYTYAPGLGWEAYNLAETIGSFLLTVGLLMVFGNLLWSRFRGVPSGPDPFYGGTLEWATTSPPPHYNFAVIPIVRSPYPNWDREDREDDVRRFERGQLVLESGHETPASTVRDGVLDEVLEMPSESGWPILLAFALSIVFIMLLTTHYVIAGIFIAISALILAAWHLKEPAEE